MAILDIKDLHISIEEREILKGINLTFKSGEVHALMGPNGNGKSTLLQSIMGHPKYEVTSGSVLLDGEDLLEKDVSERSVAGIFLGMQYPMEIQGVTNIDFLSAALKAHGKYEGFIKFNKMLNSKVEELEMSPSTIKRYLNDGFSGGEKKRNEILQMLMLNPKIAMLDEIDSGLDVDAMKIVSKSINDKLENSEIGLIIVSHYQRFYEYIKPNFVHVIMDGKVVAQGDVELSRRIDREGYDWICK